VLSDPERELMAALVTGDDRSTADDQAAARSLGLDLDRAGHARVITTQIRV
jgi:hypothetical protein